MPHKQIRSKGGEGTNRNNDVVCQVEIRLVVPASGACTGVGIGWANAFACWRLYFLEPLDSLANVMESFPACAVDSADRMSLHLEQPTGVTVVNLRLS